MSNSAINPFMVEPSVAPPAGPFDVETSIGWNALFYTGGTDMQARAYADGDDVTVWDNEAGATNLTKDGGNAGTIVWVESNPDFSYEPTVRRNELGFSDNLQWRPSDNAETVTYPLTHVIVSKLDDPASGTAQHWFGNSNGGMETQYGVNTSGQRHMKQGTAIQTGSGTADVEFAVVYFGSSTDSFATVNGTTVLGPGNAGTEEWDGTSQGKLFRGRTSGSAVEDGDVAFYAVYEGDLTQHPRYDDFVDWVNDTYFTPFDPETDVDWHTMLWAEGTNMQSEGYSDTDPVGTWPNETTNEDWTQSTEADKPLYVAQEVLLNNKPGVKPADDADHLKATLLASIPQPFTVVAVGVAEAAWRTGNVLWTDWPHTQLKIPFGKYALRMGKSSWEIDSAEDYLTEDVPFMATAVYDGASSQLLFNGDVAASGSLTTEDFASGVSCELLGDVRRTVSLFAIYEGDITQDVNYDALVGWVEDHYGVSVQGAGEFRPDDLSGLSGWWDAADPSTITDAGGGAVSQWDDKSASGWDLTQSGGTERPSTGTDTLNGLNTIKFDGSNDHLDNSLVVQASPTTIFLAMETGSDVIDATYLDRNAPAGSGMGVWSAGSGQLRMRSNGSSWDVGDTVTASTKYLWAMQWESTGLSMFNNGGPGASTGSYTGDTLEGITIGESYDGGNNDGKYAEIVMYDRALNAYEMNQVGNYLSDKWGLTWTNLPAVENEWSNFQSTGTSITATVSGATAGNLLVATFAFDKNTTTAPTINTTDGWAVVQSANDVNVSVGMAWKVADGDSTDNATWSWSTSGENAIHVAEFSRPDVASWSLSASDIQYASAVDANANPGAASADGIAVVVVARDSGDPSFLTGDYIQIHQPGHTNPGMLVGWHPVGSGDATSMTAEDGGDQTYSVAAVFTD